MRQFLRKGSQTHCSSGNALFHGEQKVEQRAQKNSKPTKAKNVAEASITSLAPKVLLQWLNFRQKLHGTCEFNKTWQPLFRSAALEEARPSNKILDAQDGVYITYTTALRCIWILDACIHRSTHVHLPEVYMPAWCTHRQLNVHCLIDAWEYVQSEVFKCFIHLAACKPK